MLLKTAPAFAVENFRSACKGDYLAHCLGVMPGGGELRACLNEHRGELHPVCAKALAG
jgi:arylformamidase